VTFHCSKSTSTCYCTGSCCPVEVSPRESENELDVGRLRLMHTPGHRFHAGKGANTYRAAASNKPEDTECNTATATGEAANER
jgi:hypothetical protein